MEIATRIEFVFAHCCPRWMRGQWRNLTVDFVERAASRLLLTRRLVHALLRIAPISARTIFRLSTSDPFTSTGSRDHGITKGRASEGKTTEELVSGFRRGQRPTRRRFVPLNAEIIIVTDIYLSVSSRGTLPSLPPSPVPPVIVARISEFLGRIPHFPRLTNRRTMRTFSTRLRNNSI